MGTVLAARDGARLNVLAPSAKGSVASGSAAKGSAANGLAARAREDTPGDLACGSHSLSQHPVKLACMHSHPHQVSQCPSTTPVVAIPVLIKAIC